MRKSVCKYERTIYGIEFGVFNKLLMREISRVFIQ